MIALSHTRRYVMLKLRYVDVKCISCVVQEASVSYSLDLLFCICVRCFTVVISDMLMLIR